MYADNDPIVLRHAEALLRGSAEGGTEYVHADVRDPDTILRLAGETLDFSQPVALSLVALTHYLGAEPEGDDVYGLIERYVDVLAPGSYLVMSQVTPDLSPGAIAKAAEHFRRGGTPSTRAPWPSSPASSTAWTCSARGSSRSTAGARRRRT